MRAANAGAATDDKVKEDPVAALNALWVEPDALLGYAQVPVTQAPTHALLGDAQASNVTPYTCSMYIRVLCGAPMAVAARAQVLVERRQFKEAEDLLTTVLQL
eukprot:2416100-Pyramimonas_sp.AAC.1